MFKRISTLVVLCSALLAPGVAGSGQLPPFAGYLFSGDDSTPPVQAYFGGILHLLLLPLGRGTTECWRTSGLDEAAFKLTGNIMPNGDVTDVVVDPVNGATTCLSDVAMKLHLPAPPADVSEGTPLPFSYVYARRK